MYEKETSNVIEHVFNEDFSKADRHFETLIDQLIDQDNVPRETVMKVLFEHFFLLANRYFNSPDLEEDASPEERGQSCIDTSRMFDANYDLMTMAQTRINDFLTGYNQFLEEIGHPR